MNNQNCFYAASGNGAEVTILRRGRRLVLNVLWDRNPSAADVNEFEAVITENPSVHIDERVVDPMDPQSLARRMHNFLHPENDN